MGLSGEIRIRVVSLAELGYMNTNRLSFFKES
jgi:hypothetical protein